MFLFARVLPLVRISAILEIFGGVRTRKPPKKGHFVDAESVRKALKIFNLTTTNAILMKLTTIMYLHESVNRKALRARNPVFWLNFLEFLDYIKNCHASHALRCIASLVKFLYKLDHIWGSIPRKTTQNRFKMITTLIFEGL